MESIWLFVITVLLAIIGAQTTRLLNRFDNVIEDVENLKLWQARVEVQL